MKDGSDPGTFDLFDYPNSPGHNDRDTSIEAAESVKPKAAALRLRVLAEIQVRGTTGATCDELEQALNLSHQTCSARMRELQLPRKWDFGKEEAAQIEDSGKRRKTRSGRNAIVWVATEGRR